MSGGGPGAAETLEQQALLSLLQGDYPTAIERYRQTAAAYEEAGRPAGVAHAHLNLSNAYARAGDTEAALEAIDEARARFLALEQVREVAMCDANRGDLLEQAGEHEDGLALKRQASDALVAGGFLREAVQCDMGICLAHVRQLQLEEGTRVYASARSRALVLKDPALLDMCDQGFERIVAGLGAAADLVGEPTFARMLCTCGQVLALRAHFEVAMRLFERAYAILAEFGPTTDLASCLMVLGNTLCLLGKPLEGIERFRQARALHLQEGSAKHVAGCDQGLGGAFYLLGQPEKAVRHYEAALLAFGPQDAENRAPLVKNIGQAYLQMERTDRARELFEEAVALFRRLNLERETAEAEINLATTLLGSDPTRSSALLWRARTYFEAEGLLKEQADCDTALGAFGDPEAIVQHNEHARKVYRTLGLRREANNCAMNVASALGQLDRHEEAVQRLRRAAEEFAALGMKKEFGECHANLAAALYRESREAPAASGDLVRETVAHLRIALEAVEALRGDVFGRENRLALHGRNVHLYELAVLCCLELGEVLAALEFFERAKAKLLAEMVMGSLVPEREDVGDALYERFVNARARVVQEGLAPDYRPLSAESGGLGALAGTPAEQAFREALGAVLEQRPDSVFARRLRSTAGTTLEGQAAFLDLLPDERSCLLEFLAWGGDDSLRAFLVTRQRGVELVTFPAGSRRGIAKLAAGWSRVFQPGVDDHARADFVAAACRDLHVHLFGADAALLRDGEKAARPVGPLLDYLRDLLPAARTAPRLFVVPHAALALLPLHAACAPAREVRYLVEDFEVVYAPSARVLALSRARELPSPMRRALLVANPQPATNPLRHAAAEAAAVRRSLLASGWEVESLQKEHATKHAFLEGDASRGVTGVHAGLYDVLHLAQHGAFDGRSSYLRFADTSDPEEARLRDREVACLPLHRAHCVVAAACWTAATDPGSVEHGGLGAAFLQAGVGTYVATIFPLSDLGSSVLVPRLYNHHFREGRSWSDALRHAQLAMIQGDLASPHGAILQHPYHWAAFTVSGRG